MRLSGCVSRFLEPDPSIGVGAKAPARRDEAVTSPELLIPHDVNRTRRSPSPFVRPTLSPPEVCLHFTSNVVSGANTDIPPAVADAVRTSLGPRGMDKMIRSGKGETIITNDGSTMLKSMSVMHPTAKMLVQLSHAQDVEAGDGTTSVVVLCGSLLGAADRLLGKGIHPSVISESFQRAAAAAVDVLHDMSQPIALTDTSSLLQAANTSLSSKIVSQYSNLLGPMAVNAVTKTIDLKTAENVDLKNIRIVKKVGGTIEDSELVDGLVLTQPVIKSAGGPVRMEKARIGLIQFQLSPPKPDVRIPFQLLHTFLGFVTI